MESGRRALVAAIVLVCLGLSACGTTGTTSPFVVSLDLPKDQQIAWNIRVASTAADLDAAIFHAVRVQPWGRFELTDQRHIDQSLRDTLARHAAQASGRPPLDVHVMIRRYMVSVSNTGGAALASVAWAASEPGGRLVHQEQFFAADSAHLVGTIGGVKDSVHRAVVRRIAATALTLGAASAQPMTFENTYATYEQAAARVPQTMVSMGNPAMAAFPDPAVGAVGVLTPAGVSRVQWSVTKPSQDFDWQGYLQEFYRKP